MNRQESTTATTATPVLESRVAHTLSKLVQKLTTGNEENMSPLQRNQQQQELYNHCARIIANHSNPSVLEDENQVANLIRRKLLHNPRNSAKALKFGHLYNKLDSQSVLHNKWSILYLLYLLGNPIDSPLPSSTSSSSSRDSNQFLSTGLQSFNNLQPQQQQSPIRTYDNSHTPQESPRTRRRLMRDEIQMEDDYLNMNINNNSNNLFDSNNNNTTTSNNNNNENNERSLPASIQLAQARKKYNEPSQTNLTTIPISEALILKDLIYIFQGIDGQYITFDSDTNEYILDPNVTIPKPAQDLAYRLTELGWLYQRIQTFINVNFDELSMGLVGQSFCSALKSELMEYYKLIAILEAQIEKQDQSDDTFIPTDQSLTLKRLQVWTQESLQRLKLMSVLVDIGRDQKGGALVSTMYNYTKHGDPFFKLYISELLQEVSKPFYEMLRRWITEGELDDPYGEFFVATDPTVSEEELWQRKYSIREDMLPSFISPELAQKIFSIGKSLNFIRYSCHDETLVEKYYAQNSTVLSPQTFKYGDIQSIERCVDMMYIETSSQLLSLLKEKYKLMDHLKALRRYLLLGQGDFIQYLMVTLGPALSRPASTLFRHNLTGILETGIRASNAQFDDPAILNRLDVRLLEISSHDLGWDVFTLDYHVDSPINTVFSPQAMNQYLRIFNFLWRLKRVEYTLTAAWRRWGTASRTFASLTELSQDLHQAQLVIAKMVHFIYQLQHYYLFEVLECSWEKLETKFNSKSIDLDSIIEAHSQYLSEIAYKGFLTSAKNQPLSHRLNSIFDVVLTYKSILVMAYFFFNNNNNLTPSP
ncbi:unnamed protein product [Cunninghamella echinulata]